MSPSRYLTRIFKDDFPVKEVHRLAFPAIIASIAEPVISICDVAIIGIYSTETSSVSIGAVSLGSSFFLSFIWIFSQMRTAMSSMVARFYGEGRLSRIRNLVPQVIALNFLIGLIFFGLSNMFSDQIFGLYNAEGEILETTTDYYSIRSIGYPFALTTLLIFGVFRGMQNTLWSMAISMAGAILNIVLDLILLPGIEGVIPAMGVKGIALASLISQLFMFICAIIFMLRYTGFGLRFKGISNPHIREMAGLTANLIVRSIAVQTAYFFSNRIAAGYGPSYINVQGIFWNIWLFSAFVIEGYCIAGNALAGRYLGEKNFSMLWRLSRFMTNRSILIGLGLMIIYLLTTPYIGRIFLKNEQELLIFESAFWLVALVQPFNALAFSYDEILKGLSRMAYIRDTLILATFLAFVPVSNVLDYFNLGLHSVWIAFIAWMLFRGLRLRRYFRREFKMTV
jgi:multidrug resistance protein, MATE family